MSAINPLSAASPAVSGTDAAEPRSYKPATNFPQRTAYGFGALATLTGKNAPKVLSKQIFNIELGVNPAVVGLAITVSRLIDAFTDPWMGQVSDRFRSRWGRRRPFLILGAFLVGAVFTAMWWFPRNQTVAFYTSYMFVFVILHYLALTVYSVPWYALGYEMSPDSRERNAIMAFAGFFGAGASILVNWIYALAHWDIFASPLDGIRWVGLAVGLLLLGAGVVPAMFIKERRLVEVARDKIAHPPMWSGIRQCFRLRQFRQLIAMLTLVLIGASMVNGLGFYVITYYIYGGDTGAASVLFGVIGTLAQVSNFILIPVATPLAGRWGKKAVTLAILAAAFVGSLLKWFCYTPVFPLLAIIPTILLSPVFAVVSNMLAQSMIADICDLDELENGVRREGLFGAIFSWTFKTGLALAFFVSGAILVVIGFKAELGGGQSHTTLTLMRGFFAFAPAAFILCGYLVFRGYDLTNSRMEQVRAELEARRGDV